MGAFPPPGAISLVAAVVAVVIIIVDVALVAMGAVVAWHIVGAAAASKSVVSMPSTTL